MKCYECPNCGSRIVSENENKLICQACGNFYTEEILNEMERHKKQMTKLFLIAEERRLQSKNESIAMSQQVEGLIRHVREMLANHNFEFAGKTLQKLQEICGEKPIVRVLYTRYMLQAGKFSHAREIIENWEKAITYAQGDKKELLQELLIAYDDELWGSLDKIKQERIVKENEGMNLVYLIMMIIAPYVDKSNLCFLRNKSKKIHARGEMLVFNMFKWLIVVLAKHSQFPSNIDGVMNMCVSTVMKKEQKIEIYELYLLLSARVFSTEFTREKRRMVIAAFRDGVLPFILDSVQIDLPWTDKQEHIYILLSKLDSNFIHELESISKKWRGKRGEKIPKEHIKAAKLMNKLAMEMNIQCDENPMNFMYALVKKREQSNMPSKWKYQYQPQLQKILELCPKMRVFYEEAERIWMEDKLEISKLQAEQKRISLEASAWENIESELEQKKENIEKQLKIIKKENSFSLLRGFRISKCEKEIASVKAEMAEINKMKQQYIEALTNVKVQIRLLENKCWKL